MSQVSFRSIASGVLLSVLVAACGAGDSSAGEAEGTVRLYTSVTQGTVDAVVDGFEAANPGVSVEVFRAPTGELTARIAAELREGELQADLLWMTDPLSIQQYAADGLLREWAPSNIDVVPTEYVTDSFFGTRILNMVIIAGSDVADPPTDWDDLPGLDGGVAIPDPGFAGSAFGALAYFTLTPDYGIDFYQKLADAGAVQVKSPGAVVTEVAEGVYGAGMTLDFSARKAVDDGSPVELVWPTSGAIAIYSPIAVVDSTEALAAEAFVEYVLGEPGQTFIAETGWQPIRDDVPWEFGGLQVSVDWEEGFDRQEELLGQYRAIFEG